MTFIRVVSFLFQAYAFLILIRVLLTWVSAGPYRQWAAHPAVRILNVVTEPVLAPLRRLIPPLGGTVDISPVVALILVELARMIVLSLLSRL